MIVGLIGTLLGLAVLAAIFSLPIVLGYLAYEGITAVLGRWSNSAADS